MKLLGIDYGEKNIGVALSIGGLPESIGAFFRKEAPERIRLLCQKHSIEKIVVGQVNERLQSSLQKFLADLALSLPVAYVDETLTSYKSQDLLGKTGLSQKRKKQKNHALSAVYILEEYLQAK